MERHSLEAGDIVDSDGEQVTVEINPATSLPYIDASSLPVDIQNCVYTCYLSDSTRLEEKTPINAPNRRRKHDNHGVFLHLSAITLRFNLSGIGAQLNKKRFAAVIVRTGEPTKIALLLFSQGKIVCTGAKARNQARYYVNWVIEELKRIGYVNITNSDLKVENIVSSTRIDREIDINAFSSEFPDLNNHDCIFPGSIFRHPDISPITILIFNSGKLVITGAKNIESAREALALCISIVEPFTKAKASQATAKITLKSTRKYYEVNNRIRKEKEEEETTKKRKRDAEEELRKKEEEKNAKDEEEEQRNVKPRTREDFDKELPPSIMLKAASMGLTREEWNKVIRNEMVI
jgi:transcription initiation factor TFIID TATA-box-binding protein